jgi:hypothetical protein
MSEQDGRLAWAMLGDRADFYQGDVGTVVFLRRGWSRAGPALPDGGHARWMDHKWTGRDKRTGEMVYVSEPYGISVDDILGSLILLSSKWDVYVDAAEARWWPGHTVAILLRAKSSLAKRTPWSLDCGASRTKDATHGRY